MSRKILVINLVGLTPSVLDQMPGLMSMFPDGRVIGLQPPCPAVTCTSQATITTGSLPEKHGVVSNGWYFRESGEVRFWMRSDRLVAGEKIWDAAKKRRPELIVANMFWRYCTHSNCDITVTERPTYWATGKKSPDIYCSIPDLRNELVKELGEFPLFRFWGPATSIESTQWIGNSTAYILKNHDPDLAFTYLPHLDYDLQKFGPCSPQSKVAIDEVEAVACSLIEQAMAVGREIILLSEYGMTEVSRPVYLNQALRENGLLTVQNAKNGELLEPAASRAFAACSHQVAHVYVRDIADVPMVKELLESIQGVEHVLAGDGIAHAGLAHQRSGELIAVADSGSWFAYPYWLDDDQAPDFASCVAIHDKPGHDPVEMFLGPKGKAHAIKRVMQSRMRLRVPFDVISTDASLIKGSHGRMPDSISAGPMLLANSETVQSIDSSCDSISMTEIKNCILSRMQGLPKI